MKQFFEYKLIFFPVLIFSVFFCSYVRADIYRFPEMYNPNPLAGRLFMQPIGTHEEYITISVKKGPKYVKGWLS